MALNRDIVMSCIKARNRADFTERKYAGKYSSGCSIRVDIFLVGLLFDPECGGDKVIRKNRWTSTEPDGAVTQNTVLFNSFLLQLLTTDHKLQDPTPSHLKTP
jgi:hypothetical protein